MFGFKFKDIASLMQGDANKLVKDALKKNYSEITSTIKELAFAKYKDKLKEGEELSLMIFERDGQIMYFIVGISKNFTVTNIIDKGNLYDFLMSVDYEEILKQGKEAQKYGNNELRP
jgi:hypothetical protein